MADTREANPILYTRRQAATALGIGLTTLDKLIRDGHIDTVSVLGRRQIPAAEVERVAENGVTE